MQTRNLATFARIMLGAMLAFALLLWMAALFLVGGVVAFAIKGVALLAYGIRRLLLALRVVKPTAARRGCCAAEDVIDV